MKKYCPNCEKETEVKENIEKGYYCAKCYPFGITDSYGDFARVRLWKKLKRSKK